MRQSIRKKLNSNRGVSIIFALALFLICTMVASLIIVAAASGSSRSNQRMEQQRAYFAISSASQMLVEDLQNQGVFVGQNEAKRYGCKQYHKNSKDTYTTVDGKREEGYEIPPNLIPGGAWKAIITDNLHLSDDTEIKTVDNDKTTIDGLLGAVIKKAAEKVYKQNTAYEETFTIAVDSSETRLPKVKCKFQMDTSYNIKIEVKAEGSAYSLTIRAKCKAVTKTMVPGPSHSCKHVVLYKELLSDGGFTDANMELTISGTDTLEKTTVSWDVPEVIKGVEP